MAEHPDVLTEGYTTTAEARTGCRIPLDLQALFGDSVDRFHWRIVESS
jgi:hypothetical protein